MTGIIFRILPRNPTPNQPLAQRLVALAGVATEAGSYEILLSIRSAAGKGDHMVGNGRGLAAVAAAVTVSGEDSLPALA
jgi:hypothetical protein